MGALVRHRRSNPVVAGLLSLFIPGTGQLYAGRVGWGLGWFFMATGCWIVSAGTLGWIFNIACGAQAFFMSVGDD